MWCVSRRFTTAAFSRSCWTELPTADYLVSLRRRLYSAGSGAFHTSLNDRTLYGYRSSYRKTCPKNVKKRDCTVEIRRCWIPCSWSFETFVRCSVHETLRILHQHHISWASILCISTSCKYGQNKRPHEPDLRVFSNVPIPPYFPHLDHRN